MWSRRLSGVWSAAVAATIAVLLCACGGPAGPAHQGAPGAGMRASGHSAAAGGSAGGAAAQVAAPPRAGVLTLTGPVVALGDSYTAGDLMPLSLSSRPLGCLRSSDGYPAQVAKALGVTADLVDVSCTGAGVKEMSEPQKTYLGTNPPQLSALASDDSLVMLTLGGDDMGFMNGLQTCMKLSLIDPFGSPCQSHFNSGGTDQLGAQAAAEGAKLVAVLDEIRARAPHARVLLVGYPDLFPQQGGCWPVVPITDGDIGYLRGIETQLNAVLAHAAQVAGATYVNTYAPTIGHDFCQTSRSKDVEGLVPTSLAAPFHLNARGQAAIAALVLGALRAG